MMILAAGLSAVLVVAGLAVSYSADLPVGTTTILLAAGVYVIVQAGAAVYRRRQTAPGLED